MLAARSPLGEHCRSPLADGQRGHGDRRGQPWRGDKALAQRFDGGIGGRQQRVLGQVAVPLCRFDLGMTENPLHLVDRASGIDQVTGERVPQVMNPHLGQPRALTRRVPGVIDRDVRLAGVRVGKNPGAVPLLLRPTGLFLTERGQEMQHTPGQRDIAGLARLTDGNAPDLLDRVEVRPARIQHLALTSPGQQQHRHDKLQHPGLAVLNHRIEPLGFFL